MWYIWPISCWYNSFFCFSYFIWINYFSFWFSFYFCVRVSVYVCKMNSVRTDAPLSSCSVSSLSLSLSFLFIPSRSTRRGRVGGRRWWGGWWQRDGVLWIYGSDRGYRVCVETKSLRNSWFSTEKLFEADSFPSSQE